MIKGLEFLQANEDEEKQEKQGLPDSIAALGISGEFKSFFATHPPLEQRIKALKELG
jgi:Zn-dependent protease with chaperone function